MSSNERRAWWNTGPVPLGRSVPLLILLNRARCVLDRPPRGHGELGACSDLDLARQCTVQAFLWCGPDAEAIGPEGLSTHGPIDTRRRVVQD